MSDGNVYTCDTCDFYYRMDGTCREQSPRPFPVPVMTEKGPRLDIQGGFPPAPKTGCGQHSERRPHGEVLPK